MQQPRSSSGARTRRWAAATVVLGIALGLQTIQAPPSVADHGASEFAFTSDEGDSIGQGKSRSFSSDQGDTVHGYHNGHGEISASIESEDSWWDVRIAAPLGEALAPGTYHHASRERDSGQPGLDVSGEGRACNEVTGSFVVHEADFTQGGAIESFRATFVQHCEGREPALRGELRLVRPHDTTPPQIWVPGHVTWEATGPEGAEVWYWVHVSDDLDSAPSLECVPPSGSFFSLGTTIVRCTAGDAAGNTAEATFAVHVVPPLEVAVELPPTGSVDPVTGVATLRLAVECSSDTWVAIFGVLRQDVARRAKLHGRTFTTMDCVAPRTTWELELVPTDSWTGERVGKFNAGWADLEVQAWSCLMSCSFASESATLRLQGGPRR